MQNRSYIAIDLKSFYASVECVERGLDPLTTNLVVADAGRTEKTICLAVSPALKMYGIPGRARLFEVVAKVRQINAGRCYAAPNHTFTGSSCDMNELGSNPALELDYIIAPPRMARYMKWSTEIYQIYLKYVAPEDIHVYSIDEVFMDVTQYLDTYRMTPRELAETMIHEVLTKTGITATAGIGTNLYLCKIAMDIVAKHIAPDKNGVRIAQLDEMSYRRILWEHRPLTDFWRVGHGYAKKLEENGLYTMGDIARCSLGTEGDYYNEDLLYKMFGINAELLIDHAWGWEPCRISDIKAYQPENNSISSGQVLHCPCNYEQVKLIIREMADQMSLDLVDKKLVTDQLILTIGYDIENLSREEIRKKYKGPVTTDRYGRSVPKYTHGTKNLERKTSSTRLLTETAVQLYEEIVNQDLLMRRITLAANHVVSENLVVQEEKEVHYEQMDLFTDYDAIEKEKNKKTEALKREKQLQQAVVNLKKKYGNNAVLKGMNLQEGGTTISRNQQIGGHKA